jgi:hypothetical protein
LPAAAVDPWGSAWYARAGAASADAAAGPGDLRLFGLGGGIW